MPETPFDPNQPNIPLDPIELEMKKLGFDEVFDYDKIKKDFHRIRPQFKRLGFHDVFDKANILNQFKKLKFSAEVPVKPGIQSLAVMSEGKAGEKISQTKALSPLIKSLRKVGGPLGKLGGVLGKLSTKLGALSIAASALVWVMTRLFAINMEHTKIQTKLRQVGQAELRDASIEKAGEVKAQAREAFGGIALIDTEKAAELIGTLAEAPQALENIVTQEGISKTLKLTKALGFMGVSSEDTAKIMAETSKKMGFEIEDLTDTFKSARNISKSTNLTFVDAFHGLLTLNEQLRNFTFDTLEASKAIYAATIPLEKMGFQQRDIEKFAASMGKMIANLTPSKIMGFTAFTTGKMATSADIERMAGFTRSKETGELIKGKEGAGGIEAMTVTLDFLKKTIGNIDPKLQIAALEKLAPQVGFGTGITELVGLLGVVEKWGADGKNRSKILNEAIEKQTISDAEMKRIEKEGFITMANMKDPIDKLVTILKNLTDNALVPLVPAIRKLNSILGAPKETVTGVKEGFRTVTQYPGESIKVAANLHPLVRSGKAGGKYAADLVRQLIDVISYKGE